MAASALKHAKKYAFSCTCKRAARYFDFYIPGWSNCSSSQVNVWLANPLVLVPTLQS